MITNLILGSGSSETISVKHTGLMTIEQQVKLMKTCYVPVEMCVKPASFADDKTTAEAPLGAQVCTRSQTLRSRLKNAEMQASTCILRRSQSKSVNEPSMNPQITEKKQRRTVVVVEGSSSSQVRPFRMAKQFCKLISMRHDISLFRTRFSYNLPNPRSSQFLFTSDGRLESFYAEEKALASSLVFS